MKFFALATTPQHLYRF